MRWNKWIEKQNRLEYIYEETDTEGKKIDSDRLKWTFGRREG